MTVAGGWIVLHLLARGEDPANIRILDIRDPIRSDLKKGQASKVQFVKVDITNLEDTKKAFSLPWPTKISNAPLTVFHTAAVIRFFERSSSLRHLSSRVNVLGTHNSLTAAVAAGASYFIFTSSGSVHNQKIDYFVPPWKSQPDNFMQVLTENSPMISDDDAISNYTRSKIEADHIVKSANNTKTHNGFLRTGILRPGSMIYGFGENAVVAVR